MPALVAGIHDFVHVAKKDVDGRNKSSHDDLGRVGTGQPVIVIRHIYITY
jgi:hypothetical protein